MFLIKIYKKIFPSLSDILKYVIGLNEVNQIDQSKCFQLRNRIGQNFLSILICILYFFYTLRLGLMSYIYMRQPSLIGIYSKWDPSLVILNEQYITNSIFGICVAPLLLFNAYLEYVVHLKPNYYVFVKLCKHILIQYETFGNNNPTVEFTFKWTQPLMSIRNIFTSSIALWRGKNIHFDNQIDVLPNASVKIRARTHLIMVIWEKSMVQFQRFLCKKTLPPETAH